jgi:hypothetical protein
MRIDSSGWVTVVPARTPEEKAAVLALAAWTEIPDAKAE